MSQSASVAFGSGSEKRTFPSFVHPDRLGNENLLPVLYQDPEMGPGKYDIDEKTTFVTNFSPKILRYKKPKHIRGRWPISLTTAIFLA